MKHEWKKKEREIYFPTEQPTLIKIPKMKYFTITGKGNPNNNKVFQDKIGVLYSLSYAIKMMPKNGYTPNGYFEYTVYPLEGIWSFSEKGIKSNTFNKDEFAYKIMIRQPDFVDEAVVKKAIEIYKKKKNNPLIDEIKFEEIEDGLCVQMLHIGSYDDESRTFEQMTKFINANNFKRTRLDHKEIYLSDFTKVEKNKLKTVLRCFVN